MSIIVMTPDHGKLEFLNADGWETLDGQLDDERNLLITRDPKTGEDDEAVAEFARGAWLFVYEPKREEDAPAPEEPDYTQVHDYVHAEDETETAAPEPRVWESVLDIPHGTIVRCHSAQDWLYITPTGGGWYLEPGSLRGPDVLGWELTTYGEDHLGPFTEVLGD